MSQRVWAFLCAQNYDKWFSVKELTEELDMPDNTVRDQLEKLRNSQKISRVFDGRVYRFRRRAYNVTESLFR
jgi:DeoR/GlpR family transcriptional regulator of sugar metabolism